ncbi:MAG: hypothetical protein A2W00_05500 [Candidatus Eisenbacteria bacterium RBG_16_71_46]|nr:MAG: hypothetical protein A2W00_05500 [Candidatus Eisenbacteria bacterium RBG_16_71_46]OGF23062.1 MAG: hypothetical protein A2V63_09370 [Candidatus Eisenbacteria bacterium RBG_19FT_COMBO_70_11]
MKRALLLAFAIGAAVPVRAADHPPTAVPFAPQQVNVDSIRYAVRVTDNNLVGVTISNYGFIGNNFISRSPSFEYPLGTGFEHMVRGGLWVGALAIDQQGAFTGVVTGAVDGSQGSASQSATEFTPAGIEIKVRSTLPNNKFFNVAAVSEQDFVSEFSDQPAKRSLNNIEAHRPMGLLVRQENYAWSFSDYQHIVIFHYVIKNTGPPLKDAWVGFYAETASGPKNAYSVWPPSSSGSTIGSWYSKKWIQYDDSLRLFREHYCAALPIPEGCNLPLVPYWVGMKLLGVRPGDVADTADKRVTLGAWTYAPGSPLRDEDVERYAIMSAGAVQDLSAADLQPQSGDPIELLAVGPFRQIDPDSTIEVDFALVGGKEIFDIQRHARFAQRAYDRDYIVPVPPPSPRFKVVARDGALDYYWDDSPESAVDPTSPIGRDFEGYRLYIGEDRLDLRLLAQFDLAVPPNDTTGFNTGFDAIRLNPPVTFDGVPYHYRYTVTNLRNGFKYFAAVTAFDLGNVEIESLESGTSQNKTLVIPAPGPGERPSTGVTVFPNPYRVEARWDQGRLVRDHYLWFANLPQRCRLKIFTLSGDVIFDTDFDGATYHAGGVRGIYDPRRELDVPPPTLSGRMFGWDLITREGQATASGLYLYSVEDRDSGKRTVGKFLVVKSDREDF